MRIFQHCPLFSQWSAQHYQTAFAEFMAYKQRVPVRGAIMLNDEMDEVVLVKGWKKSANWSFPRGKINKDEDDLDCAIREVYEETGFDLRAAGLVPDRNQAKSIEMTMREQHMKLFVFRGIPKDAHFEARTRKEISKIEWYKLTDLPAFKKSKKQEGGGQEQPSISANKFYMVAPFLGHLKKWIAQQKKQGNRYSSNLAAPPLLVEASEVDNGLMPQPQTASDLPEVSNTAAVDPTAQLKAMFNIGQAPQPEPLVSPPQPTHMRQVDAAKSNALLSLLRSGSTAEMRASPQTPMEQMSFQQHEPRSPHRSHVAQHPSAVLSPPPAFSVQTELPTSIPAEHMAPPTDQQRPLSASFPFQLPIRQPGQAGPAPPMTTHHQTGEPEYLHQRSAGPSQAPPPSALPQLNQHRQSLLDAFKGLGALSPSITQQTEAGAPAKTQTLLDILRQPAPPRPAPIAQAPSPANTVVERPRSNQQNSLLSLFSPGGPAPSKPAPAVKGTPAELSATSAEHQSTKGDGTDTLLSLLKQDDTPKQAKKRQSKSTLKEGETSAVMNGPLDQPNFEAIARRQKEQANGGMGRSPLTSHRKLYDPNEPASVKILARPQTPRGSKSPQPPKVRLASSPRRTPKAGKKEKEQAKPAFQPQILRRPQQADAQSEAGAPIQDEGSSAMSRGGSSEHDKPSAPIPQPENHRQTLLSLFGGSMPPAAGRISQQSSRVVSPLSTSQMISPRDEVPVSAVDPISTRSRMGSLVSVSSISGSTHRPGLEKRTTAPENKSFLMNYLGRMASQDG